tara:strand:- start:4357 stop:5427 length:1071 start_codon:yes stop_codon:yes gene_type:complete
MSLTLADMVFETTETQGTGDINLLGAQTGFRTFVAGAGDGATVPYHIGDNENWETGLGTITAGTPDVLSRDTVLASSNSGAAVNWGSGTRNVRLSSVADIIATLQGDNTFFGTNSFTGDNSFTKKAAFKDAGELTISSGAVTVTGVSHTIDTESDAAADDLVTINGGADGQILTIRTENSSRVVTLKTTGNIAIAADIEMASNDQALLLQYDAALSKWVVIGKPVILATQPQAEAGTGDGLMTSERTAQAIAANVPPSQLAKAWVNFNGTGTIAIRDSYNVSSIVDNGTGHYTVNFTNDMANTDYAVLANGYRAVGVPDRTAALTYTTSSFGILNFGSSNQVDAEIITAVVFGELA